VEREKSFGDVLLHGEWRDNDDQPIVEDAVPCEEERHPQTGVKGYVLLNQQRKSAAKFYFHYVLRRFCVSLPQQSFNQ